MEIASSAQVYGVLYFISSDEKLFMEQQNSDKAHFLASKVIFYKIFRNLVFY
jgi:hypothetical protein